MKRLVILGFIILGFAEGLSTSEAVVDRVVAVVNEEVITLSEVDRMIGPFLKEAVRAEDRLERKEQLNRVRRQALDTLIEEKLMDYEIKKAGIKVTPREVEAVIDDIKKQNKATQQDLERALANEGITFEKYKTQIEQRVLRTKLVQWSVKVEPKASEKQLRDFYEQNVERYRTPETFRPAHILFVIPKEAPPEKVQEVRKKCQEVLDRIRKGEDFGEMALLYSQDPSAKDRGDLGYFKKGELLPALEKELNRLRVGEVGGMIRTEFGFHLIKLLDRKGGTPMPFEEAKERVEREYFQSEMERAVRQFITSLKEKSVIDIRL
jgi:peptidyl-prolyl cis-trans isomerase SurA